MPKHKPSKKNESSGSSGSDSGPEDRGPAKKPKPTTKVSSKNNFEEADSWELGKNRFARLTDFKGKWFLDIREFYTSDDGDLKPGKKGIMLTMEQWQKLKSSVDDIEEAIKKNV